MFLLTYLQEPSQLRGSLITEAYLRRALYFLGKQVTKPQRLSKQVCSVIC